MVYQHQNNHHSISSRTAVDSRQTVSHISSYSSGKKRFLGGEKQNLLITRRQHTTGSNSPEGCNPGPSLCPTFQPLLFLLLLLLLSYLLTSTFTLHHFMSASLKIQHWSGFFKDALIINTDHLFPDVSGKILPKIDRPADLDHKNYSLAVTKEAFIQ